MPPIDPHHEPQLTRSIDAASDAHDDRRLMGRIAAGDAHAFDELYDRYRARAFYVAHAVCRDHGRAEDALQEAFVSVWRTADSYRPQLGTVGAWLLSVVRNRAIDLLRKDARHSDHRADASALDRKPAPVDVAADAVANVDAPHVRALLEQIPEAQREVIVLAFYGQLTHTEIAARLEIPPGTVKGRMRLGLIRLRLDVGRVVA